MSTHPPRNVSLINLGCARNLVDAQRILATLQRRGYVVRPIEEADTVIVNTCGFIEDAKKESLDALVEVLELKKQGRVKRVILAGCLAQRYSQELREEFKDLDAVIGVQSLEMSPADGQVSLTPAHYAYLKIGESCYNQCSFCVIPKIKGPFQSRPMEVVQEEFDILDARGVKEVNVIGQDISAYGLDLYGAKRLDQLVKAMASRARNVEWIRLLYAYPAHITDELLDVMASEPRVCRYLDVPLQHINDDILKRMNRRMSRRETEDLLVRIRKKVPGVFVRTAFIVGFPGETEEQFQELLDFVQAARFERLGAFVYSAEEGTAAYDSPDHVPEEVKQERLQRLMAVQQMVAKEISQAFIGQTVSVIIDDAEPVDEGDEKIYTGRTEFDAPDVDGVVNVRTKKDLSPGDMVQVDIDDALEYALFGEAV